MKTCAHCSETKPFDAYHKSVKSKDGLQYWCKSCKKGYVQTPAQKERQYEVAKLWVANNRDKTRATVRAYKKRNPHVYAALEMKRKASKLQQTPSWLTAQHLQEIENIYWLARDVSTTTGEDYHVDHILPLKGEEVRGLHVPWNLQILPSDLNLKKGNKTLDARKGGY